MNFALQMMQKDPYADELVQLSAYFLEIIFSLETF